MKPPRVLRKHFQHIIATAHGWRARCPVHGDEDRALHLSFTRDGRLRTTCDVGCPQEFVLEVVGLSSRQFQRLSAQVGLTLSQYAHALRLPVDFLESLGLRDVLLEGRPAVQIPYHDEQGNLAAVRFRAALVSGDGLDQRFRWRNGDHPIPYGIWRLDEARKAGYVVLVEREADAHTFWHHGLHALSIPEATGWKGNWDRHLDGISAIAIVVEHLGAELLESNNPPFTGERAMKLSESGSRGVMWRKKTRGSQELRLPDGRRERGDWWIRWACPLGHLHRELVGPKSMAQREVERRRVEQSCPRHTPKPTHYLLADVIREYLKVSKEHKRSWRDDQRYGEAWIARLGQRTLEDVTPAELEKIRIERLASRRRAEDEDDDAEQPVVPLAAATVNREMAFLRHVYNVAIRDEKTERNPVAKLKMLREPSGRVRYLTDEEEVRLMKTLATDEDRDRVTVLLQTGFRRSEFLGLRWCDVDFKGRVLTVPKSKNGEARHVPMTSTVQAILSRRPRPLQRTALVFPNSEGHRDLRWASRTIQAAFHRATITDFRFHDTRHTFASRLAMEGVDLMTIRELMGHKSMAMTLRYAHLSPGHRQNAIERLASRQAGGSNGRVAGAE